MISSLDEYLVGIVLGVRFRANFSIEDRLGQILDTILYTRNSYFNPKVFPEVRSNVGKKMLFNENTNDYLLIDNSNFILEVNFTDKEVGFQREQLPEILNNFESGIVRGVMRSFKICEIMRVGYVRRYILPLEQLSKTFVTKTVGDGFDGVQDINLRFSKRMPADEALIKKDVKDYNNAIVNVIKSADKQEIFMSVDYQSYFDPYLSSVDGIEFAKFFEKAGMFNKKHYLEWLNKNYVEVEHGC